MGKDKKTTHVTPHPGGGWQVKNSGNKRASKVTDTQQQAVDYGKLTARGNQNELFIHNRHGRIRERNSYGNDPFPPKG